MWLRGYIDKYDLTITTYFKRIFLCLVFATVTLDDSFGILGKVKFTSFKKNDH